MADRALKNRKSFFQFEGTPGVMPASKPNLQFLDIGFQAKPMIVKTEIKAKGETYPGGFQSGVEDADVTVGDDFGFASWPYLLDLLCGEATPTEVVAGSGAWKREHVPGSNPRTGSLDYGDPNVRLERFLYLFLSGLQLTSDKTAIKVSGTGKAQAIDPEVTGADSGDIVFVPQLSANAIKDGLYMALAYADLGSPGATLVSYLTRFMGFTFGVGNYYDVVVTKHPGNTSWEKPMEADNSTGDVTAILGADTTAWDMLPYIRENTVFYLRHEITGPRIYAGVAQIETATVVGTVTGDGNATVIITAAGMTGSPITLSVAVLNGDTPTVTAGKIRTAMNANANIAARFTIGGSGAAITLTRLAAAANDSTLNVSIANGTSTGLTTAASSANTTPGVAPIYNLCAIDCAVAFKAHFNPTDQAPLDALELPLRLMKTPSLNGWKITTICPIEDLTEAE
jgi:hypothetical protein